MPKTKTFSTSAWSCP